MKIQYFEKLPSITLNDATFLYLHDLLVESALSEGELKGGQEVQNAGKKFSKRQNLDQIPCGF